MGNPQMALVLLACCHVNIVMLSNPPNAPAVKKASFYTCINVCLLNIVQLAHFQTVPLRYVKIARLDVLLAVIPRVWSVSLVQKDLLSTNLSA